MPRMSHNAFPGACSVVVSLVLAFFLSAQQPATSTAPDYQMISKTGLLPMYGVDLRLDPSWVDAEFPSQSPGFPNFGVNATLQQIWENLKQDGFNVLRVPVDVSSNSAANQVANLFLWSKNNNVRLILILTAGNVETPIVENYASRAAAFVKAL